MIARIAGWLFVVLGVVGLISAAKDERRGVTEISAPTLATVPEVIERWRDPIDFRNAMTYHWLSSATILGGGAILLGMDRRARRQLPFSKDFGADASLDELNRTLTEEHEKRHRPLR